MANSKYLRWINDDQITTTIAQRFVEFCDEDVEQRANAEHFDADIYQDAMKLIIDRFEGRSGQSTGHKKNKIQDNNQDKSEPKTGENDE